MIFEDGQAADDRVSIKTNRFKSITDVFKGIFNSRTLPYILVLILVANVSFLGIRPFGFIMLAVATLFNVPLVVPLIGTLLMYVICKADMSLVINYGIAYVIYTVATSLISIEGFSKKYVTLIKIGIATLISSIISALFFMSDTYITVITNVLLTVAFYPIVTSGVYMLLNIRKKIIFSKEEIVSLGILMTFALIPFSGITLWGFSLVNVILITTIVVIGWKNDWLLGTAAGVSIGLIYSIATGESSLIITAFAFSGLIAGVLSKYNKWIVVVAFIVGNFVLAYVYTRDITVWAKLAEVLIASGIIVSLPRKMVLKLEDLFGTMNGLKVGYSNLLGPGADVKDRLNAMSEVFDNLSHITTPTDEKTLDETSNVIQKYLENYTKNECIGCKNSLTCMKENLAGISIHLAERLEHNKTITKEMIPVDCELAEEIINNLQDIYNNMKLMRIVKQRENEANEKLAEEYRAVSNLIKNMAKEELVLTKQDTLEQKRIREELKFMGYVVYEDFLEKTEDSVTYEFITDILVDIDKAKKEIQKIVSDITGTKMSIKLVLNSSKTEKSRIKLVPSSKYVVRAAVKQIRKADSAMNGDSYIVTELKDNSKIIAISDGMGSGIESKEVSSSVVSMIEKMSTGGFNKEEIIAIVNKLIKLRESGEISATLDMCAINEKTNVMEFIKLGAPSSYIIKEGIVEEIRQDNMPMGLISNIKYSAIEKQVSKGMYVVITSDGATSDITKDALQTIIDGFDGEEHITEKTLMDKIMNKIVGNQNKIVLDDVTVVVCKIA